ncbi:MAG TPA: hypothetical protein VLB46_03430 [Pyrinomonadaceae bacterium]|nr:hypothetical protein [Pyrinomonadaceae bacterium]
MPIAAGVLYPFFALLVNPMMAAAAMSVSCVAFRYDHLVEEKGCTGAAFSL